MQLTLISIYDEKEIDLKMKKDGIKRMLSNEHPREMIDNYSAAYGVAFTILHTCTRERNA
mgnify:CR=1 FL=1